MADMTSAQRFAQQLDIIVRSGEGVVFIPTAEPVRAVDCIETLVKTYENLEDGLALWRMTNGAVNFETEKEIAPVKDPSQALAQFSSSEKNSPFAKYNFLVMNWIHHFTAKMPPLLQALADYSNDLPHAGSSAMGKRLFCIVPPDWQPEHGLEQIPQVKLERPTALELQDALVDILENSLSDRSKVPNYTENDIIMIASNAAGMTEREAEGAFSSVIYEKKDVLPNLSAKEFAQKVAEFKAKAVEKSAVLKVLKHVPLSQIGGLEVLKRDMQVMAACMTPEARELGIDAPKGVFLAGPPGTGKSLMAQAVSSILNIPLIQFDVSRVFGGLVGASEKNMKEALDIIFAAAPVTVLVDEVDKVFTQGGGNDSGTSSRVLGSLLTEMQRNDKGVFWVFTANRTEGLPAELLRRGRLDELYSVSTPNPIEREAVLRIHLEKRNIEVPDDLSIAVNSSEGYVPAELENAVVTTMRKAFLAKGTTAVSGEELADTLSEIKPLSTVFADQFQRMREWAENHARAASEPYNVTGASNVSEMPRRGRRTIN